MERKNFFAINTLIKYIGSKVLLNRKRQKKIMMFYLKNKLGMDSIGDCINLFWIYLVLLHGSFWIQTKKYHGFLKKWENTYYILHIYEDFKGRKVLRTYKHFSFLHFSTLFAELGNPECPNKDEALYPLYLTSFKTISCKIHSWL